MGSNHLPCLLSITLMNDGFLETRFSTRKWNLKRVNWEKYRETIAVQLEERYAHLTDTRTPLPGVCRALVDLIEPCKNKDWSVDLAHKSRGTAPSHGGLKSARKPSGTGELPSGFSEGPILRLPSEPTNISRVVPLRLLGRPGRADGKNSLSRSQLGTECQRCGQWPEDSPIGTPRRVDRGRSGGSSSSASSRPIQFLSHL